MKIDFNMKTITGALGIVVVVGGILLGMLDIYISFKMSDVREWQKANGAKLDILVKDREIRLERIEMFNRMNRRFNRTDDSNYSIDRYTRDSDEELKQSKMDTIRASTK